MQNVTFYIAIISPNTGLNLINSVEYIFEGFDSLSDNAKKDLLLYGDPRFDINKNKFILEATLSYIKITERFSGSLCLIKNPQKIKKTP